MSDTAGGERGPSWWDVENLVKDVETRFDGVVTFHTRPVRRKGEMYFTWHVSAELRKNGDTSSGTGMVRGHMFKGSAGAKTMAAAMYLAIFKMSIDLAERLETAEQQHLF